MQPVDQFIHPRWIIPVEPAKEVLTDHSLVVHDGRILALLPRAVACRQYQAETEVELPTHALLPGFVNAHCHAAMSLLRGIADDLPLKTWLEEHIWPAEARWADREFVRDGSRLAAAEMLLGGTTCFNDMYFFPDETAAAAAEAGIRAVVGMIVIGFPTAWARSVKWAAPTPSATGGTGSSPVTEPSRPGVKTRGECSVEPSTSHTFQGPGTGRPPLRSMSRKPTTSPGR